MIKIIKNNMLNAHIWKAAILLVFIFTLFMYSGSAIAAEPGCYEAVGSSYNAVTCPQNDEIAQGLVEGKCYVRRSTDGGPQGTASYVEQQCDTFAVDSNPSGTSGGDFTGGKATLDSGEADSCSPGEGAKLDSDNCAIVRYLVMVINFLSAVALMAIIISMILAGFQYMTAQDNSGAIQAAKKRITWTLVALALFLFMYSLLDFVLPGGRF